MLLRFLIPAPMKREFRSFQFRDALFRIAGDQYAIIINELILQRETLEKYITAHPQFKTSFSPVTLLPNAPDVAKRMAEASLSTGVGPMAAVAGTMAQLAAESARKAGAEETVIDNGGDLFADLHKPLTIALYAGHCEAANNLCFKIKPEDSPLAICSSSGRMGHSTSLGECDLATVISPNASLADAAATLAANCVKNSGDINPTLEKIHSIPGVKGVIIVTDGTFGMIGNIPELQKISK